MNSSTQYSYVDMIKQFHNTYICPINESFDKNDRDLLRTRLNLIREEYDEVMDAAFWNDKENLLKELTDLVYVTIGTAITYGWDFDTAFKRIHKSNMSKLDVEGKPIYRKDGKILKGPNYKSADLSDLVK